MPDNVKVAIQRIKEEDIKSAIFSALELIKAEELMRKEGMVILLKPNILMPKSSEWAVTTHPEVVRATIQWVKQFNPSKIYVCDSSGGQKPDKTEEAMKISGISAVCEREGVECIPFEKTEREIYEVPEPLELKEFASSKLLKEADLIINLPKIKTHSQCILTCSIKNMFGTILRANKAKTHAQFPTLERFSSALADIYSVSNPQLTIVDGYLCQEGQGPSSGEVVKLDLILAGSDAVAVDTTVCKIIGFDPKKILHLMKVERKGLGTTNFKNIQILGEKIENVFREFKPPKVHPISFPLPRWLANYVGNKIFKANVKFNPKKCKLCATCWSNCPVDAISPPKEIKKGNIPKWNKKRCITCFCCGELCPHEAVNFKINYVKNAILSWPCFSVILIILYLISTFLFLS